MARLDVDVLGQAACFQHGLDVAEHLFVHKYRIGSLVYLLLVAEIVQHVHRFGSSRGVVQQGCIGQRQTGEVADHGLKMKQGFQASL